MFKRNFLLKLFLMLGLTGSFAVEDESGGSGDEQIDDDELDDEADDDKSKKDAEADDDKSKKDADRFRDMEKKIDGYEEYISSQKNEKATNEAISTIKAKHSDFDESKVYEHLKKLAETDPSKAELLNNPIGWENIWNDIKPKNVENDDPYYARNLGEEDRSEDLIKSLKTTGAISVADQVAVYGDLLD